jgi:pectate lyase
VKGNTMQPKTIPLLLILSAAATLWAASVGDQPNGWATMGSGTTGGTGGTEVTVTNITDLKKYAKMEGKYVIWVSGIMGSSGLRDSAGLGGDTVIVASDKSILGLPGAAIQGCFSLEGVKNVIIRNLKIQGPGAKDVDGPDAVHVESTVTNAWFDHLDISDGEDGNLDITKGCDFITVSWTKFTYTDRSYVSKVKDTSHRYCNLIGHVDTNVAQDAGHLNVTLYKVWWGDGVAERMPRVRFGKVHVANCLFTSTDLGQGHCIRPAFQSNLLVENNTFISQKKPLDILYDTNFTAITERNNLFTNCTGNTAGKGTAFTPPYPELEFTSTSALQAELSDPASGAGATLTWGPVSVAAPYLASPPGKGVAYFNDLRMGQAGKAFNPTHQTVEMLILDVSGRTLMQRRLQPGESASIPAFGKAAPGREAYLQTSTR